jgi:hypothetical protein
MNDDGGSYSYAASSCAIWLSIARGWTSKCSANCSTQGARRPRSGVKFMGTSSTYPCWTGANCLLTATMASTTGGASLRIPTVSRWTFTRHWPSPPKLSPTLITNIKLYRDKFVAHLDEERTTLLPALDVARGAIVFLHERLVQQAGGYGDWSNLPTSPEELGEGFAQASLEAQSVYASASRTA